MERLTKRDNDGQAMMDCEKCKADWTGKHGKPMVDCTALYCRNRLKDRIAAYEDSGCVPEGVLPKDKVDEIALKLMRLADLESICSYTRLRELAEADKDGRLVVLPCQVGTATYYIRYPIAVYPDESEPEIKRGIFTLCDLDRVGHSVFLTREEAEAALEAMKNE